MSQIRSLEPLFPFCSASSFAPSFDPVHLRIRQHIHLPKPHSRDPPRAALPIHTKLVLITLSAAQPQPNDLGEVKAFFPSWALCRAALKGATSSPGGRCEWDQRTNSSKAKFSNHTLICDFSADYRILHSKGRTVVTTLPAAREADPEKLSKLAASKSSPT